MASIAKDKNRKTGKLNGCWRVMFFASDDTRKTIRLGKCSRDDAKEAATNVQRLQTARKFGNAPDEKTAEWLDQLSDELYEKLAAVGLVDPRAQAEPKPQPPAAPLGQFIDSYIATADLKQNTLENMQQVRAWLVAFFGEERDMQTVTRAQAREWRAFMLDPGKDKDGKDKKPLGDNTIRRHIGRARQLWGVAIDDELITCANPFRKMSATVRADKKRQFYVTRDVADQVIAKCPDTQWKLLFALSRYGGLRCPSEHLALRWSDVDFDNRRIRVPSPKTAHHEGKASRMMPLWPELEPLLLAEFSALPDGTDLESTPIITRYRDSNGNLRTQFNRIIRRAGLEPWPKLFHNLRSSRQTELAQVFPLHKVCAWLGNSRAIAQEHYLQMTDADFENAVNVDTRDAQKAAHQTVTDHNKASQPAPPVPAVAINNAGDTSYDALSYPRQGSNILPNPPKNNG